MERCLHNPNRGMFRLTTPYATHVDRIKHLSWIGTAIVVVSSVPSNVPFTASPQKHHARRISPAEESKELHGIHPSVTLEGMRSIRPLSLWQRRGPCWRWISVHREIVNGDDIQYTTKSLVTLQGRSFEIESGKRESKARDLRVVF